MASPYLTVLEDQKEAWLASLSEESEAILSEKWFPELVFRVGGRTTYQEEKHQNVDHFISRMSEFGFSFDWIQSEVDDLSAYQIKGCRPGMKPTDRALYWWGYYKEVNKYSYKYVGDYLHELGHWLVASPRRRKRLDYGLKDTSTNDEEDDAVVASCIVAAQFGLSHRSIMSDAQMFDHSIEESRRYLAVVKSVARRKKHRDWLRDGYVYVDGERL